MNKNFYKLTYKLSLDAFLLILFGFLSLVLFENVLPGYFSSATGISLLKLFLFFGLFISLIYFFAKKSGQASDQSFPLSKHALIILAVPIILLLANSLWKFSLPAVLIIASLSIAAFYFFYRVLAEEN